jgi:hypothetical protein
MKIAVIYTGDVRTIRKTMNLFKKNILTNENVHVFATLHAGNPDDYRDWVKQEMGIHLKSLEWFDELHPAWVHNRDSLLANMPVESWVKHYLKTSGSMIEYYQLFMSYKQLVLYEYTHNMTYDYIMRCRPDVIVTRPLTFSWTDLTIDDIKTRLLQSQQKTQSPHCFSLPAINVFMSCLLHPERLQANILMDTMNDFSLFIKDDPYLSQLFKEHQQQLTLDETASLLQTYIKNGRYIITLRCNVLYFIRRSHFNHVAMLGLCYGMIKYPFPDNNPNWWDAESQLRAICHESQISVFDSETVEECSSLYQYNPTEYFTESGDLKNLNICFFIMRH